MSPSKALRRTSTSLRDGSDRRKRVRRLESNPKLLSLPDAALSLMFFHLGASDTGGSFNTPRYAFALAQTNSRLLRLFYRQLTHIVPDISNDAPMTLSRSHMISVLRHAGNSVIELNLPATSCSFVPGLRASCPRLQRLSICDESDCNWAGPFLRTLHHSIRSLSINWPSTELLRFLAPTPEELCLTNVLSGDIPHLKAILSCSMKKLYLHVVTGIEVPYISDLEEYLLEAVPKIQDVTVKLTSSDDAECINNEELFLESALALLTDPSRNERSKCRKLIIEGNMMELLNQAHPDATLEITRWQQTFAYDGKTIDLKEVPLWDPFLTQDISRLTAVHVRSSFHDQWKEMLSGLHLQKAWFESSHAVAKLSLNVDILDISFKSIREFCMTNWECLKNVREVRLSFFLRPPTRDDKIMFFMSFACLLNQFRGKTVWIRNSDSMCVPENWSTHRVVIADVLCALDRFEARGGDAATVRTMINNIR